MATQAAVTTRDAQETLEAWFRTAGHQVLANNARGDRPGPDYVVQVREDILEESDGPMLKYGLQRMHGERIILPNKRGLRPDPERLEWRYERFTGAA